MEITTTRHCSICNIDTGGEECNSHSDAPIIDVVDDSCGHHWVFEYEPETDTPYSWKWKYNCSKCKEVKFIQNPIWSKKLLDQVAAINDNDNDNNVDN